jgi:translocation and assembly module TamA
MSFSLARRGVLLCAAAGLLAWTVPCAVAQESVPASAPQTAPPQTPLPQSGGLDPQSPLAPLPGLGVDWPDLSAAPPEPPDPNAPTEMTGEQRYHPVARRRLL